jgi:hypothetical protein
MLFHDRGPGCGGRVTTAGAHPRRSPTRLRPLFTILTSSKPQERARQGFLKFLPLA